MSNKEILKEAIDLHVHVGPEIIPRRYNLTRLIKSEKGKIRGVGIKNHFFPTKAMDRNENGGLLIIDSVTLNNYLGGFNNNAIKASAGLSGFPIIVWFPTINARQFLKTAKYEIPEEWIGQKNRKKIKLCPAKEIKGLTVFNETKKISEEVKKVLKTIKEYKAILATGHISWQETDELVKWAIERTGIKKTIITHPLYQKIDMPLEKQKELAEMGALIEFCYSTYSIDKIPISKIAEQIKYLGAKKCILTSDIGQVFSKSPSQALLDFMILLEKEGISKKELKVMLVDNPNWLLFK